MFKSSFLLFSFGDLLLLVTVFIMVVFTVMIDFSSTIHRSPQDLQKSLVRKVKIQNEDRLSFEFTQFLFSTNY
jgi:hypothetical protein